MHSENSIHAIPVLLLFTKTIKDSNKTNKILYKREIEQKHKFYKKTETE